MISLALSGFKNPKIEYLENILTPAKKIGFQSLNIEIKVYVYFSHFLKKFTISFFHKITLNPKWFTFKKLVIGLPGAISVQAIIFYLFLLEIIIRSFQKNLTKCKKYFSAKKLFSTAKKGPKALFFIKKKIFFDKIFFAEKYCSP